jgi:ligand-binding SRPBCC domain-containing protein
MVTLPVFHRQKVSFLSITPAWVVVLVMYVITQAYVTTMAATAITINSNVASIGDMAFLDFNVFLVVMSSPFVV